MERKGFVSKGNVWGMFDHHHRLVGVRPTHGWRWTLLKIRNGEKKEEKGKKKGKEKREDPERYKNAAVRAH